MMVKYKKCPDCGQSDGLSDIWRKGRKLQQKCYLCDWHGQLRIPEKIPIEDTKYVSGNQFGGFSYEVFDRYGHIMTSSRSYSTRKEAKDELKEALEKGRTDMDAGPYTGVLWPARVKIKGSVYKYL